MGYMLYYKVQYKVIYLSDPGQKIDMDCGNQFDPLRDNRNPNRFKT